MGNKYEMTCERCGTPHQFNLKQMRTELEKTIARIGIFELPPDNLKVKWLCGTCVAAGKVGVN